MPTTATTTRDKLYAIVFANLVGRFGGRRERAVTTEEELKARGIFKALLVDEGAECTHRQFQYLIDWRKEEFYWTSVEHLFFEFKSQLFLYKLAFDDITQFPCS